MFSCRFCNQTFPSDAGYWNHTVKMHQDQLEKLDKKEFICQKCPKSFKTKQLLHRHEKKHAVEEIEICKKRDTEFLIMKSQLDKADREKDLENQLNASRRQTEEYKIALERMQITYNLTIAKFLRRMLVVVPLSCPSHLEIITNEDFKRFASRGEGALSSYMLHVYYNPAYPERQSFLMYKGMGSELFTERFDCPAGPERVDSVKLLNEFIESACQNFETFFARNEDLVSSFTYSVANQQRFNVRNQLRNLKIMSIYRDHQIKLLTNSCISYSLPNVKLMKLGERT